MTITEPTPDELARQAYAKAIRLLGARDHSVQEIQRKLLQRDIDPAAAAETIAELLSVGYLDDNRFANTFAEQRMAKGYGPLSIRSKLQERGIDGSQAAAAIDALDADWSAIACEALQRRFTEADITNREPRQRARIARFLQSRGFTSSQSLRAIEMIAA